MATYRLLIEYDGTRYSGWQVQRNTPRTVQGMLLEAATDAWGEADLGGSGRTDAGVHALGQSAHLRIRGRQDPLRITRELNDRLPADIHVAAAFPARDGFHSRHDAQQRVYLYQISRTRSAFLKPWIWWIRDPLDVNAMREATVGLTGMHDFAPYADARAEDTETRVVLDFMEVGEHGDLILVRLSASHFLWKMVRKLVSALVEVGRGAEHPGSLIERLETGERFSPTAPPSGLFLEAVLYEGEVFDRPLLAAIDAAGYTPLHAGAQAPTRNRSSKPQGRGPRRRR